MTGENPDADEESGLNLMLLWSCALEQTYSRVCLSYISIFFAFQDVYDAQKMDRHCVDKMSVIVF